MDHFSKNNKFYLLYFLFIMVVISEARKAHEMCIKYTKQARDMMTPSRIVGGRNAEAKEYPHMALLGYSRRHFKKPWRCGGSLISENFVMSAAHCMHVDEPHKSPVIIRLGELNWNSTTDDAKPVDYNIIKIIVHPRYNETSLVLPDNDIALIKFQGLSAFNDYIRPICLNTDENIPKQKYISIEWGNTEYNGNWAPILQSVELDRQDDAICYEIYEEMYDARTKLCVGYAPGGKGSCSGDSGSPLQIIKKKLVSSRVPIYTQIGILSGGMKCALPNTPKLYVKVSYYIPWIERIVWN